MGTLTSTLTTTMAKTSNNRTAGKAQGGYKNERASKDGRKQATKGGKGGKVQSDGTAHRSMGYLAEEHYIPSNVSKNTDLLLSTTPTPTPNSRASRGDPPLLDGIHRWPSTQYNPENRSHNRLWPPRIAPYCSRGE